MTVGRRPLRWLPPFLLGLAAATAAETAVALLLYAGPGLVRSLTTVLSVEAAALGVGLWMAPGPRPDIVEALRRWWLFCLLAFLAATLFSGFWSLLEPMGGRALGQGLGLAFLAALPLYACGGVLGAFGAATGDSGSVARVGAAALLGGAVGFAATGMALPQVIAPASLLLICLVLLSAGGIVTGAVLETRLKVHVRARRESDHGEVRVEDRYLPSLDWGVRILLEDGRVRRWYPVASEARTAWDLAFFRALEPTDGQATDGAPRILLVGGGASGLPRAAIREHEGVLVEVLERNPMVVELAREHLDTGLVSEEGGRVRIRTGNLLDLLEETPDAEHDLVAVDTSALPRGGGWALPRRVRELLAAKVAPGGVLAWGPGPAASSVPLSWSTAVFRRRTETPEEVPDLAAEERVTVSTRPGGLGVDLEPHGFVEDAQVQVAASVPEEEP